MATQNVSTQAAQGNTEETAQLRDFFDGLSNEELIEATMNLADTKDATGKGRAESFATMKERNNAETEFDALTDQIDRLNLLGASLQSMEFNEHERHTAAVLVKEACSRIFAHAECLLALATK